MFYMGEKRHFMDPKRRVQETAGLLLPSYGYWDSGTHIPHTIRHSNPSDPIMCTALVLLPSNVGSEVGLS